MDLISALARYEGPLCIFLHDKDKQMNYMGLKLFINIRIHLEIECSTSAAASLTDVDRNHLTYSYTEHTGAVTLK